MYLSSYIQVPDKPGKIVRRKKGKNSYVLYEVDRRANASTRPSSNVNI